MPAAPGQPPPDRQSVPVSAADLFRQLFPDSVQMTGELFADLAQLLHLTSKLAAGGDGTTPWPDHARLRVSDGL